MSNLNPTCASAAAKRSGCPIIDAYGNTHCPDGRLKVAERQRKNDPKHRLTAQQERDVAQEYADKEATVGAIASKYEMSPTQVRRLALLHGVSLRETNLSLIKSKVDVVKVMGLTEEGRTAREIAQMLRCTTGAVENIRARTHPKVLPVARSNDCDGPCDHCDKSELPNV